MTVNMSRSQREALMEGATDGKYRKVAPNTEVMPSGGITKTMLDRSHLHPYYNYGYPTRQIPLAARAIPGH